MSFLLVAIESYKGSSTRGLGRGETSKAAQADFPPENLIQDAALTTIGASAASLAGWQKSDRIQPSFPADLKINSSASNPAPSAERTRSATESNSSATRSNTASSLSKVSEEDPKSNPARMKRYEEASTYNPNSLRFADAAFKKYKKIEKEEFDCLPHRNIKKFTLAFRKSQKLYYERYENQVQKAATSSSLKEVFQEYVDQEKTLGNKPFFAEKTFLEDVRNFRRLLNTDQNAVFEKKRQGSRPTRKKNSSSKPRSNSLQKAKTSSPVTSILSSSASSSSTNSSSAVGKIGETTEAKKQGHKRKESPIDDLQTSQKETTEKNQKTAVVADSLPAMAEFDSMFKGDPNPSGNAATSMNLPPLDLSFGSDPSGSDDYGISSPLGASPVSGGSGPFNDISLSDDLDPRLLPSW